MRNVSAITAVSLVAMLLGAMPASATGGGEPTQIREEFVETFELPDLAEVCWIDTVEVVEFGEDNVKLFPNGSVLGHLVERGVLSNPETGDETHSLQSNTQATIVETTLDDDVLTVVLHVTVAGLADRMLAPKQGVVFTLSGRFEAVVTLQFDLSTNPPTMISFDEEILSTAGSIRDGITDDELSQFCEALGGSFSP